VGLPLTDPVTGELKKKEVFIIFYKSPTIERKISKICDAFAARRYPIPDIDDASKVREVAGENAAELNDARVVLQKNKDARYRLCKELASKWEDWMWTVVREKSIYHTLNNFKSDVSGMLRGEGWIVSSALPKARAAITDAHSRFESSMPSLLSKVGRGVCVRCPATPMTCACLLIGALLAYTRWPGVACCWRLVP
jgi:V-type H+-transporting ATPase subunit a